MSQVEFDKQVRGFVATGSGVVGNSVIPGNDNAPSPQGLYATVLFQADEARGYPAMDVVDTAVGMDYRQREDRRLVYSVQFYRVGAVDAAVALGVYAAGDIGGEDAERRGFRVEQAAPVRRIDTIIDDEQEERAALDLIVLLPRYFVQSIRPIESVPATITADDSPPPISTTIED